MKSQTIDKMLAEETSELLEAIRKDQVGSRERLVTWLSQSKRHVRHYLMMVALDRELNHLDAAHQWDIGSGSPESASIIASLIPCGDPIPRPRWKLWSVAAGIAAGLLILGGAFVRHVQLPEYTTAIGEQRAIELEDGSILHLNTNSHLKVEFSERDRVIHLLSGEALFKVHRDPSRPFRVLTADAIVTAVGTEFSVYRRVDGTSVAVLEGRVRVSGDIASNSGTGGRATGGAPATRVADLSAGQQAMVSHQGEIARKATTDVASVAAWRQRRLVFQHTPLPDVVGEFNRYNRTPRFELKGSEAGARAFSGIFDADDPESLVQLLKGEHGISIERDGANVVIHVMAVQNEASERLER